ncbi:hypothetical protein KCU95_g68, partial [Aureobasidium melanogenum]
MPPRRLVVKMSLSMEGDQSNILSGLLSDRDDTFRCGGYKNRTVIVTHEIKVAVIADTESGLYNIFGEDVRYIVCADVACCQSGCINCSLHNL